MSIIQMKNTDMHTFGELPKLQSQAPEFILTKPDLSTVSLADFSGKAVLLNVYPSVDTQVCYESVKTFNQASDLDDDLIIACISMDLPFALQRIQIGESLDNIQFLSDFRNREFGDSYGLTIADGPLAGLLARAVIVLDKEHKVIHQELVADISNPPNYQAALESLK